MFFPIGFYREITQLSGPGWCDGDVMGMLSEHFTSQSHCWFRNKPDQHIFQLIGWLRIQNKNYWVISMRSSHFGQVLHLGFFLCVLHATMDRAAKMKKNFFMRFTSDQLIFPIGVPIQLHHLQHSCCVTKRLSHLCLQERYEEHC